MLDVPQRLEETGTGRPNSAAGPVVPKEPDPAVEVAVEAKMNKTLGCFDPRALSSLFRRRQAGRGFHRIYEFLRDVFQHAIGESHLRSGNSHALADGL